MPPSRTGEKLEAGIFKPVNASFSRQGKARGRDLEALECLLLQPGKSLKKGSSLVWPDSASCSLA